MAPDFQFATAWVATIQGKTCQILAYLWTVPDDEEGDLAYEVRVRTWWGDACLAFELTQKVGDQEKAMKGWQDILTGNGKKSVEGALEALLADE